MATIIRANGTEAPINAELTLERMQAMVGGWIEVVTLDVTPDHSEVLIVNEEGLLDGLPPNAAATRLYRGSPAQHDGLIVGDAIHCKVLDLGLDTERYV